MSNLELEPAERIEDALTEHTTDPAPTELEAQSPQNMLGDPDGVHNRSKRQLEPATPKEKGELPMSLKIFMPGMSAVSTSVTAGYIGLTGEARFSSAVLAGSYFVGCLYLIETLNISRHRRQQK